MKLSLTELSRLTGIAASNLSAIELGKSSPTLSTFLKIASAFNMRAGAFLEEALHRKVVHCTKDAYPIETQSSGVSILSFTEAIPVGKLKVRSVILREMHSPWTQENTTEQFVYCVSGSLLAKTEQEVLTLSEGEGLYLFPGARVGFERSGVGESQLLLVSVRNNEYQ